MNFPLILYYICTMLKVEAIAMLPSVFISLASAETKSALAFALTIAITLAAGFLHLLKKPSTRTMRVKDGFVIVSVSWIALSLFGALPFVLSGSVPSFVDAFFETVSGFTTTGATILSDVEVLPKGLLYWRSFTHWLGGMGVLVFVLALMPKTSGSSGHIFALRAESPGPTPDKLTPKLKNTALTLYVIYTVMTIVLIIMLLCGGMGVLDSFIHAFGTAGTGGFSSKNLSLGAWDSKYLQNVITIFMALFGVNFSVYFAIVNKKFSDVLRDSEFRAYILILIGAAFIIAFDAQSAFTSFGESLHHAFFQVSSIMTTTGFGTANFDVWPAFSKLILLSLMVIGASAGSTGGGIKVVRVILIFKAVRASITKKLHPNRVKPVRLNGKPVSDDLVTGVLEYLGVYVIIFMLSTLIVSIDAKDIVTSISSVLACFNNIGPGLANVGPLENYSALSSISKIVLSANMLLGRLEIYPLLILFCRSTWKKAG